MYVRAGNGRAGMRRNRGVNRFRSGAADAGIADKRGMLVGDDHIQRIMILALAMRHSVERPAISMEGGKAYGAALPAAVCEAFEKMIKVLTDLRRMYRANFDEMRLTVRRI